MAVADTSVVTMRSSDSGAPAGLTFSTSIDYDALFTPLFVDGYGQVTLDSLTVSSNVATGYCAAGHGFTMLFGSDVGPVIQIAGATSLTGLNGRWRLASVTDSQYFTFITEGIGDGTASGTITAKRAPAGWTKEFTGTNHVVYRSAHTESRKPYFKLGRAVSGSGYYTTALPYFDMTDINTGTFWGSNSSGAAVYNGNNSVNRAWRFYADERMWWFFTDSSEPGSASYGGSFSWIGGGDIPGAVAGDPWGCFIRGYHGESTTCFTTGAQTWNIFAPANYGAGSVSSSTLQTYSWASVTTLAGSSSNPQPSIGGLAAWEVKLSESSTTLRGSLPLRVAPHTGVEAYYDTVEYPIGYVGGRGTPPNIPFVWQHVSSGAGHFVLIPLIGPWY